MLRRDQKLLILNLLRERETDLANALGLARVSYGNDAPQVGVIAEARERVRDCGRAILADSARATA